MRAYQPLPTKATARRKDYPHNAMPIWSKSTTITFRPVDLRSSCTRTAIKFQLTMWTLTKLATECQSKYVSVVCVCRYNLWPISIILKVPRPQPQILSPPCSKRSGRHWRKQSGQLLPLCPQLQLAKPNGGERGMVEGQKKQLHKNCNQVSTDSVNLDQIGDGVPIKVCKCCVRV